MALYVHICEHDTPSSFVYVVMSMLLELVMKLLMILCQVMRIVLVRGIMHNGNMFLILENMILIGVRM